MLERLEMPKKRNKKIKNALTAFFFLFPSASQASIAFIALLFIPIFFYSIEEKYDTMFVSYF
jgi:hypothetical protein